MSSKKNVVIVGGGNLASGLANMFSIYNDAGKYSVSVYEPIESKIPSILGSSHHGMDSSFRGYNGIDVDVQNSTLAAAAIVILAIPAKAIRSFVMTHLQSLSGSILVDCSNPGSAGDDLQATLEDLGATNDFRWVKGLNDNGAIELINHKVSSKKFVTTKLCGPDESAVNEVKELAETGMGFTVKIVPFSQFDAIALDQNKLGKTWVHAAWIMVSIFAVAQIFSIVREHVKADLKWQYFPLYTTNHSMAWTCIWGFALAQLPGVIARFYIMFGRYQLPNMLLWALNLRKELGVISLFFLLCHAIMSLTIWNAGYFYWAYDDPTNVMAKYLWHVETSLSLAILSFGLYVVLGICSLPSVAAAMNSRQWQFVYGVVAWTALILGLCHNIIIGKNIMKWTHYWPDKIPHVTVMSCTIPIGVIGLKLIQMALSPFNCKRATPPVSKMDDTFQEEA